MEMRRELLETFRETRIHRSLPEAHVAYVFFRQGSDRRIRFHFAHDPELHFFGVHFQLLAGEQ